MAGHWQPWRRLGEMRVRLDSDAASADWNRSAQPGPPRQILWCDSQSEQAWLADAQGPQRQWGDPLAALDWMSDSLRSQTPDSQARWIGYLSYDLGRRFEQLPPQPPADLPLPLFVFTRHDALNAAPAAAVHERPLPPAALPALRSNFTPDEYQAAVARVIEYIRAGDVFQVNLSQRFAVQINQPAGPRQIYARLAAKTPAAYGACLDYGDFALLSNSPELFLRVGADRGIVTRPIKGTRPRRPGGDIELRDSIKDQAELNMIVDLERNDLGRICRVGSIRVVEPRVIETHPTVYHGAATIQGVLREGIGFVQMLAAMFPGGSVTGAPKIRAMQIIDELEPAARGPYCGAIGYLAAGGAMEFNLAIRTMMIQGGRVCVPVGGGIVADSDPVQEYQETLVKAQAMLAALGIQLPPAP
jgi:para-aminobenzoate synthetase component I